MSSMAADIFQKASSEFQAAIPDSDRHLFTGVADAKALLAAITQHVEEHPANRSRLMRCSKKIQSLSRRLTPFFQVVDIFVQANSECAALIWGSIRLVFQLGTNHVLFLEKLCTSFENMAILLPPYEEYINRLSARARRHGDQVNARPLKAMGHIYSDLIQFCFDAFRLLSRRKTRLARFKGSVLDSLNWKPFDMRYDDLLKRWEKHTDGMEAEMRLAVNVEQMEHSEKLDELLGEVKELNSQSQSQKDDSDIEQNERRVHRIKKWIGAPMWCDTFEKTRTIRSENTTEWFLQTGPVSSWIRWCHSDQENKSCRNLIIEGKPGLGKTVLSTTLIEHLQPCVQSKWISKSAEKSEKTEFAFFYFDKQRHDKTTASSAIRAILTQLLHSNWVDQDLIDILLILWHEKSSGQLSATDEEIDSALKIILPKFKRLVLVLDGIDECCDPSNLFRRLDCVRHAIDSFATSFFLRPTLRLPAKLTENCSRLHLHGSANLDALRRHIRPRIIGLLEDGSLPSSVDVEATVRTISCRANGMFLWVTLLLTHLGSPFLSSRQKLFAIENLNRFQGLDALYSTILESLERSLVDRGCPNIARAFQIVAFAYDPISIQVLEHVVAMPLDRRIEQDDVISNLATNLGQASGALMEVSGDGLVRFIHVSVLDYLRDPERSRSIRGLDEGVINTNETLAHAVSAACCLSYLNYTIPHEPLGGSSQTTADARVHQKLYPFFEYASNRWSFHLLGCLRATDVANVRTTSQIIGPLIRLLSRFLSRPQAVTVWIEASWMFQHSPCIRNDLLGFNPSDAPDVTSLSRSSEKDQLDRALPVLHGLSTDLNILERDWGDVLLKSPNEIWEPSISAFTKSSYWSSTPGAHVTRFTSAKDSVCVKSEVSSDGLRLGIARLYRRASQSHLFFPPEESMSPITTEQKASQVERSMIYELWDIPTRKCIHEAVIEFSYEDLEEWSLDEVGKGSHRTSRFHFPVVLSTDLLTVAGPGKITRFLPPNGIMTTSKAGVWVTEAHRIRVDISEIWKTFDLPLHSNRFEESYRMQLSAHGEYAITIHDSEGSVQITSGPTVTLRLVSVYHRDSDCPSGGYSHLGSIAFEPFQPNSDSDCEECPFRSWSKDSDSSYNSICLHPRQRMLGFKHGGHVFMQRTISGCRQTWFSSISDIGLWDFSDPANDSCVFLQRSRVHPPGTPLEFSACGKYFCHFQIDELTSQISRQAPSSTAMVMVRTPLAMIEKTRTLFDVHSIQVFQKAALQTVDCLTIDSSSVNGETLSELHRAPTGAVILNTLNENGFMTSQTLTQLPTWTSKGYHPAILSPNSASDSVTLVLNRSGRFSKASARFNSEEMKPFSDPMILERDRVTIPTFFGRGTYQTDTGMTFQGPTRKRIGWFDHRNDAKRRRR